MARVLNLRCRECARRFGGDEGKRKHRRIRGDRAVCMSDAELLAGGWTRDRDYVWHRPVGATAKPGSALVRPTLFDSDPKNLARTTDPITSHVAARAVSYRTGSRKALLYAAYLEEPDGLTDEEVAARCGMSLYEATKRCSDLRRDGAIIPVGVRKGRSGLERQVCRVVEAVSA